MTRNVERAGFTGLAVGFIVGMLLIAGLTTLRSPLMWNRSCDEATEVAVLTEYPDGETRQAACMERWRVVVP